MNIVFLPATAPDDETYGMAPKTIGAYPRAKTFEVRYPRLVWYNASVRSEAAAQIRALNTSPLILVGFSKSGNGAWNIARTIPQLVRATIIFDAPMVRTVLPPWETEPFYADDASWQKDLPLHSIREFQADMPVHHRLILISGQSFHDEMCQMSDALSGIGLTHTFLSRPQLKHHWDSGWIEEGLSELAALDATATYAVQRSKTANDT